MRNIKDTLFGFIFFLITASFCAGFGILIYTLVEDLSLALRFIALFLYVLFVSFIFTLIDYIRRKNMIDKPLKDILRATESMTRGNFNIKLYPTHSYNNFDEFDFIKDHLNNLAQELSKNEMLKSDFISNVSHEIKTPLSIIMSYAQALNNPKLNEEDKKKYLVSLNNACKRLNVLVNNILKLNKLENQSLSLEIKKFNLSESLTNQVLKFEELFEKKNINLICDIDENLYITNEESYLEIVWNNLIINAIKFSNETGVIKISLHKENEEYIIKVQDFGEGMDKNTGMHIFDKFYQGDTSRAKEGNGLGLALVKKVIDILGGSISVESQLKKGSTFTVKIKEI